MQPHLGLYPFKPFDAVFKTINSYDFPCVPSRHLDREVSIAATDIENSHASHIRRQVILYFVPTAGGMIAFLPSGCWRDITCSDTTAQIYLMKPRAQLDTFLD